MTVVVYYDCDNNNNNNNNNNGQRYKTQPDPTSWPGTRAIQCLGQVSNGQNTG